MELCLQLETFLRSLNSLQAVVKPQKKAVGEAALQSVESVSRQTLDKAFDKAWVCQQVLDLQSQFQAIVVAIEAAGVDPSVDSPVDLSMEPRLRSYQTEAYRWLRLLSVESMRLRTARAPETITQGRSQLETNLNQLQPFVEAIASEICPTVS